VVKLNVLQLINNACSGYKRLPAGLLNTTLKYLTDCDGNGTIIPFELKGIPSDVPIWVHGPVVEVPE